MPRPNYAQAIRRERHPFQPDHLPGLRIWVAAHRIDGLLDNDPITTVPDLSGLGNDFAQATAGDKPLFKTGIVNGYPVMRFDGTTDFLESPYAASDESADSQAWFAVFRTTTTAANAQQMILWAGDGAANGYGAENEIHMDVGGVPPGGNVLNAHLGGLNPNPGSTLAFTDTANFHAVAAQFTDLSSSAPTVRVFVDGAPGPVVTGSGEELSGWSGVTRMGRPGAATRFFSGDVAEAAVFNPAEWGDKALINHTKLAAYAKAKYALLS